MTTITLTPGALTLAERRIAMLIDDSLPTSANQEDHVSMATFAARRLSPMADDTRGVLAIGWLCAAQGIDLRRPLESSDFMEAARTLLRACLPVERGVRSVLAGDSGHEARIPALGTAGGRRSRDNL